MISPIYIIGIGRRPDFRRARNAVRGDSRRPDMPGLRRRQEQFRRGRGAARKARRSPEKERPAAFRRAVSKKSGGGIRSSPIFAIFVCRARCATNSNQYNDEKNPIPDGCNSHDVGGGDAVTAQTLEPEFEGEVVGVFPDGSSKKLEKHNVRDANGRRRLHRRIRSQQIQNKSTRGRRLGQPWRFDAAQPIALIVRAKDNKADPMSIVRVFRMKSAKKNRSAVISAVGSFSVNSNTMDYLRFSAEKYGESSYRLTFDERPAGEYGIIVSNPNNVDEKMVIVSTFAIDGGAGAKE